MPLAPASSAELVDLLKKSGILSAARLSQLSGLSLPPDPQQTAAALVEKGFITRFQAQQLLAGRHKGFRLGSYAILDLLGRGGMGAVYLGEHIELHRKVAIKVLVPGKDDDQKLALERFAREARAAAALDHPNIVRVFDVYRPGETPYIVLEFVEGETLQDIVARDGPIPYATAAEYVAQAASGLQHAHEKGFVHRDIKPANLMRDPSGVIKILDMGLARSDNARDNVTELYDAGAVVGTADFIAPEQGMSHVVDIRADIYSLGATLFALVAGRPPFEGNTTQKLLQHQMKEAPTLTSIDSTMPAGLSMVVAKMLAKKPDDRYQTPAEVIAALSPWIGGNSGLILAGMARTNMGQSIDLQATLAEISRVTTRRSTPTGQPALTRQPNPLVDSGEVNPVEPLKETDAISSAKTTRERPKTKPLPVAKAGSSKKWLFMPAAVAVLAAGAVAGWLVFGGDKEAPDIATGQVPAVDQVPPNPTPSPLPKKDPDPKPNPEVKKDPDPKPTPKVPAPGDKVALRLDLTGQKPFVLRSGLTVDPTDMSRKDYRFISQTGGDAPKGWTARAHNKDTEMEFFAEEDGGPVLGIRNVLGPASAMLFTPRFDAPGAACRVRIEYSTNVRDGKFVVKYKANDNRPAWEVARLAPTGPTWRTDELGVDLRGSFGGFFEFHNSDDRPDASVRVRSLTVTEAKAKQPERVVFSLDAADLPFFKNTKAGNKKTEGTDAPAIKGVGFGVWKPDTVSEWECGTFAGARAVAFTNLSGPISAHISLELEKPDGMGFKFDPNQQLRLRVVYRTAGKGAAKMYFQVPGDQKGYGTATLTNSNDAWRTADVVTTRGDKALRCVIDATEAGAGNTLYVRSIAILDMGKAPPSNPTVPKTAPPPANPDDITKWAEGAVVHKLTFDDVPAFRVQKEKGMRLGGEPEKLPPGIGCQCWKEKAVGDFRCEKVEGSQSLGLTNLNDEMSAQFTFALEGGLKLPFEPGKSYRVKVGYMTKNDAAGNANIQLTPGFKGISTVKLPKTDGKWATTSVSFTRPPAEDMVEVRMSIDNTTVGEGNTLWIRSLDIVELVPPPGASKR